MVVHPAENLSSADPVLSEVDLEWPDVSLSWWQLAEGTVRPGGVVVLQVFGQRLVQVVLIDDQKPVEDLPASDSSLTYLPVIAGHLVLDQAQ